VTKHRVTCDDPECRRVWRENCADCAQDMADKHRRETGHPVTVALGSEMDWQTLKEMTGLAHPVLLGMKRRGW